MDIDMQHVGHAEWTWSCIKDMDRQQGHAYPAWTCILHMLQGHGHVQYHGDKHAAWKGTCTMDVNMNQSPWTCIMDIAVQHGNEHACTMGMYMQNVHGHGYGAWTLTVIGLAHWAVITRKP